MTADPNANRLTAEHVKALREADTICFDTNMMSTHQEDWTWGIRAIYRETDTRSEYTVYVPVHLASIETYDGSSGPSVAFESLMSAKYDERWRTMLRDLKVGARIALRWYRGNNSPLLDEVGLCCDMLDMRVELGGRSAGRVATTRISTRVCRDNSARMVRRGNSLSVLDR